MLSLTGLQPPEVPCVVCGRRVSGLGWGDRCPDCQARRKRRASRLARSISLASALVVAILLKYRAPPGTDPRLWIGIGTLTTFLLVRVIVLRVAMEVLKDETVEGKADP
jgi:Zn finger protein HypA/HybF involved in hydrogenase expression